MVFLWSEKINYKFNYKDNEKVKYRFIFTHDAARIAQSWKIGKSTLQAKGLPL